MPRRETILIPPMIGAIVDKAMVSIADELELNNNGKTVDYFYTHGTTRQLANRLATRASDPVNKNKRFPLIGLIHNYGQDASDSALYSTTELTLWIMNLAPKGISYEKRYEENFPKFLFPIMQEIVFRLKRSGNFQIDQSKGLEHSWIERPNWGVFGAYGNTATELGELVDGIELKLNLRLNYTNCLRAQKENRIIN